MMEATLAPRIVAPDDVKAELQARIEHLLVGSDTRPQILEDRPIKKRHVYRQVWRAGDRLRAFVLKKFEPERSGIERQAIGRWLPILGMADVAPALLAVVATSDARSVWHVYEDLGDRTLDADDRPKDGSRSPRDRGFLTAMAAAPDWQRLKAVLSSLAQLHEASAGHAILGECRHWTGDLGGHFLRSNVRDAIAALEALSPDRVSVSSSQAGIRDALLETLRRLNEEVAERCAELEAFGGPECLLHGDFGVRNAMVVPSGREWAARLIDWDHAGVGPASYDLATLLLQLPQDLRTQALESYCSFRRRPATGWPTTETWNALFDTAERSRFANMAIWPALWAMDGERESAFDNLSAIASWFEFLQPVLAPSLQQTSQRSADGSR